MVERAIDHVVHCVRDMEIAAAFYEGLGFTLTPLAHHPFGTDNRLAQLDGCFIELLALARPDDVPEAGPDKFSFGAYNQNYLNAGFEGMSMLALASNGWEQDRAGFEAAGLPLYEPFGFGRTARQPDGTEATLDFRLTFTTDPAMPFAPFFTCNHRHAADVFYKPDYQAHANGAHGLDRVIMVADDPAAHAPFLERLFDGGSGPVRVMTPDALNDAWPGAGAEVPVLSQGEARFMGYGVVVTDLDRCEEAMAESDMPYVRSGAEIYVLSADALGALIVFSRG